MSLKIRALLQTVGIIVGIVASSVLISFVMQNISLETGIYILGVGFFAIVCKLIYDIVLGRLQYEETLKKVL